MSLVITISGAHGVGKTIIGKKLSVNFNLEYSSAGKIFRKMATKKNMTCAEYNKYACKNLEIDKKIDNYTLQLAKKGNIVLDGTLTAWVTRNLKAFRILLVTPLEIRLKRIAERDNIDFENAKEETISREKLEKERFKELYNVNIDNLSMYDISINTYSFKIDSMIKILIRAINEYKKNKIN